MTTLPADIVARMVALRRDLHQHPELSLQEHRTADRIEAQLRDLGGARIYCGASTETRRLDGLPGIKRSIIAPPVPGATSASNQKL